MKKQLILFVLISFSISTLFISGCKKSSDSSPTPAPTFTNDAAFLAGTYTVSDKGVTPSSGPITYTATITASTTVNGSFTIKNFANGGSSVNVTGTYTSSGNLISISRGAAIGGGKTLDASGSTCITSPVKLTIDYNYSISTSNDESIATYTKN